jgi:transcriptional regulator with XRE-family HTH domain
MKDRIVMLMKAEGLTNSKFALILGIQRSNITHILEGRNKPSLSFIEKLLLKFPSVNTEWLITGAGEMYRQNEPKKNDSPTLFSGVNTQQVPETQEQPQPVKISEPEIEQISEQTKEIELNSEQKPIITEEKPAESFNSTPQNTEKKNPEPLTAPESDFVDKIKEREIECVLIFYTDKTFKYYNPV